MPDAEYGQFPSGGQVYKISVDGGRPEQFLTFDAFDINFNKKAIKSFITIIKDMKTTGGNTTNLPYAGISGFTT